MRLTDAVSLKVSCRGQFSKINGCGGCIRTVVTAVEMILELSSTGGVRYMILDSVLRL